MTLCTRRIRRDVIGRLAASGHVARERGGGGMAAPAVPAGGMPLVERIGPRVAGAGRGTGQHAQIRCGFMTGLAGGDHGGDRCMPCSGERRRIDVRRAKAEAAGIDVARAMAARGIAIQAADRDVIGRKPRGPRVVMAAGAATCDSRVIEASPGPPNGGVANIALESGRGVVRALTLSLYSIVAGRAAAHRLRMVKVDSGLPCVRRVAHLAAIGRHDVGRRLGSRTYDRADSMAGVTIGRRPLEYCIDVA